jgi:hypothetical protein
MPIWTTTPIEQTPELQLATWRVFEVESERWEGKTRHFVGYNLTEREGRVSSKIETFDKDTNKGITESGRVYELVGEPGSGSSDGMYTFNRWCNINKITKVEDVTDTLAA